MRNTYSPGPFFVFNRAGQATAVAALAAAMMLGAPGTWAQEVQSPQATTPANAPQQDQQTDAAQNAPAAANATLSATPAKKKGHIQKDERVMQTKDTRAELRRQQKYNPLVGKDASLPDKQLYDKALTEEKKGHFDVARLDLQTLLNTYPDSEYLMRAKLAVADSWFQEGGSAGLAQAEQEYGDFITFFPNVPEAGEAQMRMGDIYLKQMDVPDRDYSKAMKAEEQYRVMLKTYPDAPPAIRKQAEQKLRDVQEVLAQREFELGQFYAARGNYPAAIARYQTVVDTYPLFSHMDDALIGLGDSYEADANVIRQQATCDHAGETNCISEAAKARLEQTYDSKAAAYYRDVVLNHAAAPHVEDAKERLQGMNLPLPQPTAEQVAASDALEGSRAQYTMRKRLEVLFVRRPDTVTAAQIGAPPLEDAAPTLAPTIVNQITDSYKAALDPSSVKAVIAKPVPASPTEAAVPAAAPAAPAGAPAAAPTLSDVPSEGNSAAADTGNVMETSPANSAAAGGTSVGSHGASIGAEVLTPGVVAPGSETGAPITTRASDAPAATGKADANYGIVAPKAGNGTVPLPPAEAPAAAPDAVNEVAGHAQPAAEQKDPNSKKKPRPEYDKNDESSSKHKKKKGVDKLNPF